MERTPPGFVWLLFVGFAQTFAYFLPAATWSPMSRFAATHAVVEHGRLEIGDFARATGDRALREGRWYSDKAPLPALAAVPAYALQRSLQRLSGRDEPSFVAHDERGIVARRLEVDAELAQLLYVCSVSTSGLAGACLGVMLFVLVSRRHGPRIGAFAAFATMLGTPIFPYATSFYGHVPAAAALTAALLLLDSERLTRRHLLGIGAALGVAVGCEYLCAIPAATIGLGLLHRERARAGTTLLFVALGAALPIGVVAYVHTVCFGGPLRTGYAFLTNTTFVAGHRSGLMGIGLPSPEAVLGLLFGERRGLFRLAPVALAAVFGLGLALRRGAEDRTLVVGTTGLVLLLLANAGYYMWWGGAASGPRHLVPMLPVLALGLGELLRRPASRPWVVGLTLVSVFQQLALTSVGLEAPERGAALLDYAYPELLRGHVAALRGASNLGLHLGLPTVASLAPWIVFVILVARLVGRMLTEEDPEERPAAPGAQRPDIGASRVASVDAS